MGSKQKTKQAKKSAVAERSALCGLPQLLRSTTNDGEGASSSNNTTHVCMDDGTGREKSNLPASQEVLEAFYAGAGLTT